MVSRGLGWFVVGRRWQVLLGAAYRVGRARSKSDEEVFFIYLIKIDLVNFA